MDIAVKKQEAFEDGQIAGEQKKAIETAKKMIIKNYAINDISELTGLSVKEIQELQIATSLSLLAMTGVSFTSLPPRNDGGVVRSARGLAMTVSSGY